MTNKLAKNWDFDLRVRARNLKKGVISTADVDKLLGGLADVEGQSEPFTVAQPGQEPEEEVETAAPVAPAPAAPQAIAPVEPALSAAAPVEPLVAPTNGAAEPASVPAIQPPAAVPDQGSDGSGTLD